MALAKVFNRFPALAAAGSQGGELLLLCGSLPGSCTGSAAQQHAAPACSQLPGVTQQLSEGSGAGVGGGFFWHWDFFFFFRLFFSELPDLMSFPSCKHPGWATSEICHRGWEEEKGEPASACSVPGPCLLQHSQPRKPWFI